MINVEALYRQHSFAVFRRCQQLLHNEAEAEEMAQDVFLQIIEKPNAFAGRSKVSTYLYAAATHMCLNRIRHRGLRTACWQDLVRYHLLATQPQASLEVQVVQTQLVASILEEQDDVNALIALYHYVDGLPQGEISLLVQLSRVTVNQRLGRFNEAVRQRWGEAA